MKSKLRKKSLKHMFKKKSAAAVALALITPAFSTHAADVFWTGATSTEWFTLTNWSGGFPGAGDNVHIDNNSTPFAALIDTSNLAIANTLFVGDSGTGSLGIVNTQVTLTTTSAYIGNQAGSNGTMIVDVASLWNNSGDVYVGNQAGSTGTLQVADSAVATIGGTLYIAHDAGSTGTVVIGNTLGSTALSAGGLVATAVVFGDGTGTLTFNHTSTGFLFSTPISGNGTINVAAGTTLLSGDDSGFTGTTNISGGTLYLDDTTLGGTTNLTAGVLTGYGTLTGAVNVASGAALSPTVGETLTVNNNVTLASGALYQAQIGTTTSGLLHATGTVNVSGATLQVVGSGNADDYGYTHTYTVMTADSGVTGNFASVTNNNLSFLDATVAYPDSDNVTVTLTRNGRWLVAAAQTPNQQGVAGAVETLGSGNAVYDALITASGPNARTAYDSLSGEIHASAFGAMLAGTRVVRDALMERMYDAASEESVVDDSVIWMKDYGDSMRVGSSGGSADLHQKGTGLLLGADHPVGPDGARAGVALGYGGTSFGEDGRASSASDMNYRAALYGGLPLGGWNVRLASDYAWHRINTQRTATLPGFTDKLTADYDAHTWQTLGEVGHPFDMGEETTLEPYLGFTHIALKTDDAIEQGGVTALDVQGRGYAQNYATLGVHLTTPYYIGDTPITTHTTLAWQRRFFGRAAPVVTEAFESDPQASFTTTGALGTPNTLKFDLGGDVRFSESTLMRVDGTLQLGGMHDYGIQALFVYRM